MNNEQRATEDQKQMTALMSAYTQVSHGYDNYIVLLANMHNSAQAIMNIMKVQGRTREEAIAYVREQIEPALAKIVQSNWIEGDGSNEALIFGEMQ